MTDHGPRRDRSDLYGVYCAIDVADLGQALALVEQVRHYIAGVKLGLEFFTANGPEGVMRVKASLGREKGVFLDLKLHDIPNTVYATMLGLAKLGVDFTTIHSGGGKAMILAAKDGAIKGASDGTSPPAILAVTVLTSLGDEDLAALGVKNTPAQQVAALAELALNNGADGLVNSGHEIAALREKHGKNPILVVPGLRPLASDPGDQKRIMTPAEAWGLGGNLLVVGRPISQAVNPGHAAMEIAQSIGKA